MEQSQPDFQTLYNSLASVVDRLQEKITNYEAQIRLYEQKEKQWATERENQLAIFQQMLNSKNLEHNAILEENQRLNSKIRDLSRA